MEFQKEIQKFRKVLLDSSILIYHLEDFQPYANLTENIFTAVADRSLLAVLSTISVTELLVQPFAHGGGELVTAFERFLFSLPNLELVPPSYPIAREAALLRSRYRLRTPDALLAATALEERADAFITNDAHLRNLNMEGLRILILDDYFR
jgi:predicted nucleic acid-binding protein